ncbi:hypothetical protein EC919_11448 [Pseudomonas graminis]|nr:hypothetical protein EC919_11448 [Pseudomonas graminis]
MACLSEIPCRSRLAGERGESETKISTDAMHSPASRLLRILQCSFNQLSSRVKTDITLARTLTAATATAATRAAAFIVTAATAATTVASPARSPEWPASGHGRHHRDDHRDFRYTTQHFDFSLKAGLITGIHHLLLLTARACESASWFGTDQVSNLILNSHPTKRPRGKGFRSRPVLDALK